jgi:hypothetical protein
LSVASEGSRSKKNAIARTLPFLPFLHWQLTTGNWQLFPP